jgi:hypothetical protein
MKREVIQPHSNDKLYARHDKDGQFSFDQANVGKSLSSDRPSQAKTIVLERSGRPGRSEAQLNTISGGPVQQDVGLYLLNRP